MCVTAAMLIAISSASLDGGPMIIIAHRGASGYLPEHTLPAVSLAYGMGADYIEQDVVLTKDNRAVVLHDIHLDTVTDVAKQFPGRSRADGRFYAIDFNLDELNTLRVHERVDHRTGQPIFPGRFPLNQARFSIPTLEDEIELVQGLNKTTGRNVGIYPEIKQPAWHRNEGYDASRVVLDVLTRYGYTQASDAVYLQCFDATELKRIKQELQVKLRLVQLLSSAEALKSPQKLREIASYAAAIGPSLSDLLGNEENAKQHLSEVVETAHAAGLVVHPYTYRADLVPPPFRSFDELLAATKRAGVDGIFADFPDQRAD